MSILSDEQKKQSEIDTKMLRELAAIALLSRDAEGMLCFAASMMHVAETVYVQLLGRAGAAKMMYWAADRLATAPEEKQS